MIVRNAGVGLDEEIADFRIEPAAEDRLAARQDAGLERVEIAGVPENLSRASTDTTPTAIPRAISCEICALAWWLYGLRTAPSSVSARPMLLVDGTWPVVRNVTAAAGAAGPPSPLLEAALQRGDRRKQLRALGSEPAVDHNEALNNWPTLVASRSVKTP